jgi:hypothetical protein
MCHAFVDSNFDIVVDNIGFVLIPGEHLSSIDLNLA